MRTADLLSVTSLATRNLRKLPVRVLLSPLRGPRLHPHQVPESHFYDGLERRSRTQRYDGYETTYGYDVKGNRTLVRDGDGVETAYTYDTVDRLSSATTPVGTTTYEYFEDGLLKTTRYGATMTERRSYDAASRLTVVEAVAPSRVPALVSRFDYAYDANGNRESQDEARGLTVETTTYGYDEADRLIGVAYPGETHLYRLDAVGNRTGEKRAAAGVVAALTVAAFAALSPTVASAAVERQHNAVDWVTAVVDVKASTTTALVYDANGNRTGEGTKQYAWDIRDTLTRASDGATVLGTYDYDAKLQRVKADTTQGHVEYVLDGKYVLREAGARSRRYHFGEGEALAVTGVGGASGQGRWLLVDALGSVVTEADASASSVTARQFDAWGNYRNDTAPTANETRLGYTGHQFDVETGLTYARARYYDSKLGVFLSRDSFEGVLSDAPSLHRFAYSHNQPLKYRDPSGRAAGCLFGGAVGCVADFVQWNRAFLTWGQDNSANRYVQGDIEFMKGAGNAVLGAARGLYEAQKAHVLGRNADGSLLSGEQLVEGGPLQQLTKTVLDPGYAAKKLVTGLPKSFERTGQNWGEGVSALVDGDYERAGELIPAAELETLMLAEGGRGLASVAAKSPLLRDSALANPVSDPLGFGKSFERSVTEATSELSAEMSKPIARQFDSTPSASVRVGVDRKGTFINEEGKTVQGGVPPGQDSIFLDTGPSRSFRADQRRAALQIGDRTGCVGLPGRPCGTTDPGTKAGRRPAGFGDDPTKGNFIINHVPKVSEGGAGPFRGVPHCSTCSAIEGYETGIGKKRSGGNQ